ncbi:MAG: MFS transporter [Sphingomonas sanxanigenens]|uniref:MFS transporter n=1 Tax=Sphingomonas sanxanigenens TaxID=397260 RepID=A0A2W5A464_9SPHN|nr:MAG: MFS transporter [Sphingomonas sanxanigenens]
MKVARRIDRDFSLLFVVMLTIAAGNTALQSVLPALGRSLHVPDSAVALAFSVSALVWVLAAPVWARRSEFRGRKRMVALGIAGFTISVTLCGLFLAAGVLGWIGGTATLAAFICARMIYGGFGAAAPPAAQAIVVSHTSREERTKALTLLASAFGLGTILGPAFAPFFVLPVVGLAGPALIFAAFGGLVLILVMRFLSDDPPDGHSHGAATSYPSIGGEGTGASVVAATAEGQRGSIALTDPRIWPWMIVGLVSGHAQAMTGQAIGFLVIDRLGLPPVAAQEAIGIVLMTGAGATLLAQWGIIPILDLSPRSLVFWGGAAAAIGCVMIGLSTSLYAISVAMGIASIGFGFLRPAFTAGASLAVGADDQAAVAGRTTSVNGAAFVLGPSIGVGLYEAWGPLPYLVAAAALLCLTLYATISLRPSARAG